MAKLPFRPKLFVHVGPTKTGTSAVQHALRAHDDSVVLYPKVGLWADGAHHNLVFNVFGDYRRHEVVRENAEAMLAEIGAQARACKRHVVISSEALPAYDVGAFVHALLPHVGIPAADARIIVVCREHFGRVASLYNQNIKDPFCMELREPGEFLRGSMRHACYIRLLKKLFGTGVPVIALNYHPAADFVPRFLARIGFPPDYEVANEPRNVSLSVRGMIALLAVNHVAEDSAERARLGEAMAGLKHRFAASGFIFDAAAAALAAPIFAEDRAQLAKRLKVQLPAPDLADLADTFFLDAADLQAIAEACRHMDEGDAILDQARRYLRAA